MSQKKKGEPGKGSPIHNKEERLQMKAKRISLQKTIWCKIRYYQQMHDIPNERLALILGVSERTMRGYDAKPDKITLDKVDHFLYSNNVSIEELISQ